LTDRSVFVSGQFASRTSFGQASYFQTKIFVFVPCIKAHL